MLDVYIGLCRQTFTLETRWQKGAQRRDTEAKKKELFVMLFIRYILKERVHMCECHLQRQHCIWPEIIHDLMKRGEVNEKKMLGKERGRIEITGTDEQNVNVTASKRRRDETGEKGGEAYRVAKRDR